MLNFKAIHCVTNPVKCLYTISPKAGLALARVNNFIYKTVHTDSQELEVYSFTQQRGSQENHSN